MEIIIKANPKEMADFIGSLNQNSEISIDEVIRHFEKQTKEHHIEIAN
ncbi:MAG: hypothetical protein Q4D26_07650 [Clostridia bacterium]|nr:hypothetical protein [Clostridia bacterium]